ncbi:MAG TPA: protein kinase [Pirellulaceae bacterium]|nr:protein kinase [Pirellulaceae bacterium]HMO91110.1 protein kinase [Pirellulaceae bacterium]HMP70543.1 protein kinase [Pirellulaceae bacterium]
MAKITITKAQFLEYLQNSHLFNQAAFETLVNRFKDQEDPGRIARTLITDRLLTEWQAKTLLKGRSRLTLGKYVLLDQIARDQLGDRFVAQHTSLDRKVELQILPATFTDEPNKLRAFMQQVQNASMLDHRHLVHVYDIDKEGGRYYLVLEHVAGKVATEIDLDELSDIDVGLVLYQALDGVRFAHSHGIVHGNIGLPCLLFHKQSDVRIADIGLSMIRRQLNDLGELIEIAEATPESDLRDLGKTVIELVKRCRRSNAAGTLLRIATDLSNVNAYEQAEQVTIRLKRWLDENKASLSQIGESDDEHSHANEDTTDGAAIAAAASGESVRASALTPAESMPAQGNRPTGTPEELGAKTRAETRGSQATKRLAKSPAKFSFTAISISVLLAAIVLVGAYVVWNSINQEPSIDVAGDTKDSRQLATGSTAENNSSRATNNSTSGKRGGSTKKTESLPSEKDGASQPSSTQVANKNQADEKPDGNTDLITDDVALPDAKNEGVEQKTVKASDNDLASILDEAGDDDLDPSLDDADDITEESLTASVRDTFDVFPQTISLPQLETSDDTQAVTVLTELFPASGKLDRVELLTHASDHTLGSRLKLLEAGGEQRWFVEMETDGQLIKVAELTFAPPAFSFQWLEPAATNLECNYLRNCVLQVSVGGETRSAILRHPIMLDPLHIDGSKFAATLVADIPWMPSPTVIGLDLMLDAVHDFPEVQVIYLETQPKGRQAESTKELRVVFDRNEDQQFFWLSLRPEFRRNRLSLKGQMYIQPFVEKHVQEGVYLVTIDHDPANGTIYRPADFKKTVERLSSYRRALNETYTQRKYLYDTRAIEKDRTSYADLNKKISAIIDSIDSSLNSLESQLEIVKELVGKPIPVRIAFKSDSHDQVYELARTSVSGGGDGPRINLDVAGNTARAKNVLRNSELNGMKGQFTDWEFAFTRGGTRNDNYVLNVSENELVINAYDSAGSMTQTNVNHANVGGSRFGTAQIKFNFAWHDHGSSKSTRLDLFINETKVFEIATPDGDGTGFCIAKGVNGSAVSVSNDKVVAKQVTPIVVDLPNQINAIETVRFAWVTGNDRIKVDDVELYVVTENGFLANYDWDANKAPLANTDCVMASPDSSLFEAVAIALTNPGDNDRFLLGAEQIVENQWLSIEGTALKCSLRRDNEQLIVDIHGPAPPIQFALALRSIFFTTDKSSTDLDDRFIEISAVDVSSREGRAATVIALDK